MSVVNDAAWHRKQEPKERTGLLLYDAEAVSGRSPDSAVTWLPAGLPNLQTGKAEQYDGERTEQGDGGMWF